MDDLTFETVGRPYIYGLCLAGDAGVEAQIRTILSDFELTLGLIGYKDIKGIWHNRSLLEKE
jgi:isopentenyl diphosphate isomerase/L-lactate dehydrogenase-like FMN-dependent dehydrogenase